MSEKVTNIIVILLIIFQFQFLMFLRTLDKLTHLKAFIGRSDMKAVTLKKCQNNKFCFIVIRRQYLSFLSPHH